MLRLKRSLCGCSLTTGAFIIGWMNLMVFLFSAIGAFSSYQLLTTLQIQSLLTKAQAKEKDNFNYGMSYSVTLGYLSILFSAVYILLLIGVAKRISCLILPSVILGAIGLIIVPISIIGGMIATMIDPSLFVEFIYYVFMKIVPFITFCFTVILIALIAYSWRILYSSYLEVKDEELYRRTKPIQKC